MDHQQQPATAICIKASLVATSENRFIALPSPASFNLLVEQIATVFNLSTDQVAVRVHYVDDESDRVAVSSDDELACALSLLPTGGRPLRLFVSTTVGAATQPAALQPAHEEQNQSTDVQPTTTSDVVEKPNDEVEGDDGETAVDALKPRLAQQGIEVCEKRCVRVLAKFGGDVDKALAALERCHGRRKLRLQAGNNNSKCIPDPAKLEALHQQREVRRAERLATRLARQSQKKQLRQASNGINEESAVKKKVDSASAETLVARMAELGLAVGAGRCTGALRRADGDVDAAQADLVAWCAKRQERKRNKPNGKTTAAPIDDADQAKQLSQLDQMGFGPSSADDKAAERTKRRNERLLKRFNGDVAQVAGLLEARKAKAEARIAARKTRQGERPRCKRAPAHPTEELVAKAPTAC